MIYNGRQSYGRQRRHYSRSSSKRSASTASPYCSSRQFVLMEFISLDVFTFERFSDFYARKYGSGPQQYMRRTYPQWKSGATKMAGQTVRRILECVPPFLTKEKQFELLALQIPSVIQQQKSKMKASSIKASQLESTYCNLAASVTEHEYELDWFLKEIFPS